MFFASGIFIYIFKYFYFYIRFLILFVAFIFVCLFFHVSTITPFILYFCLLNSYLLFTNPGNGFTSRGTCSSLLCAPVLVPSGREALARSEASDVLQTAQNTSHKLKFERNTSYDPPEHKQK